MIRTTKCPAAHLTIKLLYIKCFTPIAYWKPHDKTGGSRPNQTAMSKNETCNMERKKRSASKNIWRKRGEDEYEMWENIKYVHENTEDETWGYYYHTYEHCAKNVYYRRERERESVSSPGSQRSMGSPPPG